MKRRPSQELLDTDSGTPEEVASSIADLRWFNKWFGGLTTTRALLEAVSRTTGKKDLSILEVASGGGFLPQLLSRQFEQSGIRLRFTLLDRAAEPFRLALGRDPHRHASQPRCRHSENVCVEVVGVHDIYFVFF